MYTYTNANHDRYCLVQFASIMTTGRERGEMIVSQGGIVVH